MFKSTEIRWFFKGEIPESINNDFNKGIILPIQEAEREDFYLRQENDDTGIKLRQGKIEIKQLVNKKERYKITDKINGNIETWRKWSFNIFGENSEYTNLILNSKNFWKGITKNRKLKKYEINGEEIIAIDAMVFPSEGCGFELTSLITDQNHYYTLGLEAFGNTINNRTNLLLTIRYILKNDLFTSLDLTFENSLSYPAWLKYIWQTT